MHIRNIRLFNFKNYDEETAEFSPGLNCIVGDNGAGKTNLLDAIHYLSLTRSAFSPIDKEQVRHGEHAFLIQGKFVLEDKEEEVRITYTHGPGKQVLVDGSSYERLSDHIGRYPVVMIAPDDTYLVREGSENRRRFFDSILCQADRQYMQDLMEYNKYLRQRNALLKMFNDRHYYNKEELELYTSRLITLGEKIHDSRLSFIKRYNAIFSEQYQWLSDDRETPAISYKSEASGGLQALMEERLEKDRILERTTAGIHRDDYRFLIDGHSLKKYGSQGQQKSFVIALKLTQFHYLSELRGDLPVLLLDDIFDKLDGNRIQRLISRILAEDAGQVFITDARPERTRKILEDWKEKIHYFIIKEGAIVESHGA
jgi:DNA replication and repair protein RecF